MKGFSNFSSRKEWEDYLWKEFIKILEDRKFKNNIHYFLLNLLTANEKRNLIRRLVIISLIKKGKSYKEISEILWLSPNTISSINKSFKNNHQYQSYIEISKNKHSNTKNETSQQFKVSWDELADALIELLETSNKIFNKFFPPITGRGRRHSLTL